MATAQSRIRILVEMEESIKKQAASVAKEFEVMGTRIKAVGKSMTDIGKSMSVGLTLPIVGMGVAALKSAADLETMEVGFRTMLGSAEAAGDMVKQLAEFTASTPFQLEGVSSAARQLLTAGIEAENVQDILKKLGDVAATANVPIEDMATIFSKVQNRGKATTEELNQLSERGVPILQVLADQFDVTKEKVFEMATAGQISADEMTKAFTTMTSEGGIAAGAMAAQSQTIAGLWSTLKDNVSLALGELGSTIVETFNLQENIPKLIDWISSAVKAFQNLSPGIQKAVVIFGALIAALGPVFVVLGTIISSVGAVVGAIGTVISVVGGLSAAFAGFAAVALPAIGGFLVAAAPFIAVAAAIAGAAFLIIKNWDKIKGFFQTVFESAKNRLTELFNFVTGVFNGIATFVTNVFNGIIGFFEGVWNTIKTIFEFGIALAVGVVTLWLDSMGIDIEKVFAFIVAVVKAYIDNVIATFQFFAEVATTIWNGVIAFFTFVWNTIKAGFDIFAAAMRIGWQLMWDTIDAVFRPIVEGVMTFIQEMWDWITSIFNSAKDPVIGAWTGLMEGIKSVTSGAMSSVKSFISNMVNFITQKINGVIRAINSVVSTGAGILNIDAPTINEIPQLAEGGIVTKPTLAMIGEGGEPEAVIPLSKMNDTGMGGGTQININWTGAVDRQAADMVARQIMQKLQSNMKFSMIER